MCILYADIVDVTTHQILRYYITVVVYKLYYWKQKQRNIFLKCINCALVLCAHAHDASVTKKK